MAHLDEDVDDLRFEARALLCEAQETNDPNLRAKLLDRCEILLQRVVASRTQLSNGS